VNMTLGARIAHNTLYLALGKIASTAIGVFTIALLLRYLSPDDYGRYTAVLAFVLLFGTIADFGLNLSTTQDISERQNDIERTISSVFTGRVIVNIILVALLPFVLMAFPYEAAVKRAIMLASLLFFTTSLFQVLASYFQKTLQAGKIAIAELAGRVILLVATLIAIQFSFSFFELMLTVIASGFTQLWVLLRFTARDLSIRFVVDVHTWKRIALKTWPIALSVIFTTIYFKGDAVILSLVRPYEDVGIYGAAYKILEVLITLPILIMGLILPHLTAHFAARDTKAFLSILQKTWDALSMVTLPMVAGVIVLAKPIINLVAGAHYYASAVVLQILIVATGIIFLGSIFTHAIVAINKQKSMVSYYAAAAVGSVALYAAFIPTYTYYAAAAVTVAAELFIASVAMRKVLKVAAGQISLRYFGLSLIASIGMAVGIAYAPFSNICALIAVGALFYVAILYALGVRFQNVYNNDII